MLIFWVDFSTFLMELKFLEMLRDGDAMSQALRGSLRSHAPSFRHFQHFFFPPHCSLDALSTPGKITCALASHKTYIASLAENEFKYKKNSSKCIMPVVAKFFVIKVLLSLF